MKSRHLERTVAAPALIVAAACLVVGAGAAAAFESDTVGSLWGGLWWALCLMTTVGRAILDKLVEVSQRVAALEDRLDRSD